MTKGRIKIGDYVGWVERLARNPTTDEDFEGVIFDIKKGIAKIRVVSDTELGIAEIPINYLEVINKDNCKGVN